MDQQTDQLALIEKMLEEGKNEAQIMEAFGIKPPPAGPAQLPGQRMGPVERPSRGVEFIKNFLGIGDGRFMDADQTAGSIPIPFTQQRLRPADAAMAAMTGYGTGMGVKSGYGLLKNLLTPPVAGPTLAPKVAQTVGPTIGRMAGQAEEAAFPGFLTAEEGGQGALNMARQFGTPKPPVRPRLVPGPYRPSLEETISNILTSLYGK